ncbi:tRNA pseudouridine synthase A [Bacteroidia bacterium]|nr:tRNA pseudouridine synthase A [Bacteroidia bacterium]
MRYYIELAYKGTRFHGWQMQGNAYTVQSELNRALQVAFRLPISTYGCGRTDTGVHARQFFAQFDVPEPIEDFDRLVYKLNGILLPDISIFRIFEVESNASTRFDAIARTYKYFITTYKSPFLQDFAWYIPTPLDLKKMNRAAKLLTKTTEFGSFVKANAETKTNTCYVKEAEFEENPANRTITFTITSNRFLRSMVRTVVGTLVDVGKGKISYKEMKAIIDSQDRQEASDSAPAAGLFLWAIRYPYI